jgi:hypothetical protein
VDGHDPGRSVRRVQRKRAAQDRSRKAIAPAGAACASLDELAGA